MNTSVFSEIAFKKEKKMKTIMIVDNEQSFHDFYSEMLKEKMSRYFSANTQNF